LVIAEVIPRPAVKAVFTHARDVIRDQILAELVALVDGAPDFVGLGMHRQARAIAQAGGKDSSILSIGIEDEDGGARLFGAPRGTYAVRGFESPYFVR
jgi:hypothetical protein